MYLFKNYIALKDTKEMAKKEIILEMEKYKKEKFIYALSIIF